MTALEFCRGIERRVEETLKPLHIKVVIHTPRRLRSGPAGFCHIAVESYVDLQSKGKRQFASLTISPTRSEITDGAMINSHALSLIKQIVKEYAFYRRMHIDAITEHIRDANRILAELDLCS
jgi:hypothetical protein